MSDAIGPVAVLADEARGMLLPGVSETSQETQRVVDEEVRKLVEGAHEGVTRLLEEHRQQLDQLAHAVLDAETLDARDAYAAAGLTAPSAEPAPAVA
jgi:cell division protease FtsH